MSGSVPSLAWLLAVLTLASVSACDEAAIEYRREVLVTHTSDAATELPATEPEDASVHPPPEVDAGLDASAEVDAMAPPPREIDAGTDADAGSASDAGEPDSGAEQPANVEVTVALSN